jgi:hypothetical protein
MWRIVAVACLTVLPMAQGAFAQKRVAVDLELAFVVDASGSIDAEETRLQRQGYAEAIANPRVLDAIGSGFLRSIAVAYVEFAADGCERQSVEWMRISGLGDARVFGAQILAQPVMICPGGNAIGDAVAFAARLLETNGFEGTRRVIDVSGDGPNTLGQSVFAARDAAVAGGITINGLVIERPEMPDLPEYYRTAVTGGAGSFVIKAESRETFAAAILKKLIREIASRDIDVR